MLGKKQHCVLRGQKISTFINAPFINARIEWLPMPVSMLVTSFPSGFINSRNIQGNVQVFSAHSRAVMTKADLTFQHFV